MYEQSRADAVGHDLMDSVLERWEGFEINLLAQSMKSALLVLFLVFGAAAFAAETPSALSVKALSFQGNRRVV